MKNILGGRISQTNKMASTGKIAANINSNQYDTEKYLGKLEKDGEVHKTKTPNATYWKLKGKKKK